MRFVAFLLLILTGCTSIATAAPYPEPDHRSTEFEPPPDAETLEHTKRQVRDIGESDDTGIYPRTLPAGSIAGLVFLGITLGIWCTGAVMSSCCKFRPRRDIEAAPPSTTHSTAGESTVVPERPPSHQGPGNVHRDNNEIPLIEISTAPRPQESESQWQQYPPCVMPEFPQPAHQPGPVHSGGHTPAGSRDWRPGDPVEKTDLRGPKGPW